MLILFTALLHADSRYVAADETTACSRPNTGSIADLYILCTNCIIWALSLYCWIRFIIVALTTRSNIISLKSDKKMIHIASYVDLIAISTKIKESFLINLV